MAFFGQGPAVEFAQRSVLAAALLPDSPLPTLHAIPKSSFGRDIDKRFSKSGSHAEDAVEAATEAAEADHSFPLICHPSLFVLWETRRRGGRLESQNQPETRYEYMARSGGNCGKLCSSVMS